MTVPSYPGFYNGDDRCIGVVWSPDSSSTMLEFTNNINQQYIMSTSGNFVKQILQNGNPDGTSQFLEATAYTPVNTIAALLVAQNSDTDSNLSLWVEAYESHFSRIFDQGYYRCAVTGWIELERGASRDFKWNG